MSVTGSDGRGRVGAAVVRVGAGVGDVVATGLGVGAAVRGAGVRDVERDALGNADGDGLAEGTASG